MSVRTSTKSKLRLGDMLVEAGMLTQHRLDQALQEQKTSGRRLGEILMTRGWVSPMQLHEILATQMGLDLIDFEERPLELVYAKLIPEAAARRLNSLPVGEHGHQLVVAMEDPFDVRAIDDMQAITGRSIRPVLANPEQLARAINHAWTARRSGEDDAAAEGSTSTRRGGDLYDMTGVEDALERSVVDASTVEFVEKVVSDAISRGVSDIHLEAEADELRVRYRLDGVLRDVARAPAANRAGIVSRIKVMADIDITNRRQPQDGRITTTAEAGHEVSLRVVTVPTVHGESVVMRVLDGGDEPPAMASIGMLPRALSVWEAAYTAPSGGVLVTGPTGSGKTTTLYATLHDLNRPESSIVTVEDPVEYRMAGIKQMQVNNKAGVTFSAALRSILRADPDIVLVGEIRDAETAKLAAEASLTGHLVLSTLHTNSAAATPIRLLEMGVEPFLVTAGVTCIAAQRLARRLCDACARPHVPDPTELESAGWPSNWDPTTRAFRRPLGCETCNGTGYKGRFAIHEVMPVSEEIAAMILARAATAEIQRRAQTEGMLTLRQDGLYKAGQGATSLAEISRVTMG